MNVINDNNIVNSLNDKNHLQDIINIGHLLNNNNKNNELKPLIEKSDNHSLFYYFANKEKIYNKKGTKPLNKDYFMNLIYILKEYINQNEDYILYYFQKIKIDILKVIINGYIIFEWEEKEKNEIYNFIIIIIPFFLIKKYFIIFIINYQKFIELLLLQKIKNYYLNNLIKYLIFGNYYIE